MTETFLLSGMTNMGDFVPVLNWFGLNGIDKRLKALQHKRCKFTQDLIEEHRRENMSFEQRTTKTMVDVLLSLKENEPEYYTDEIIRGIMQVCFLEKLLLNEFAEVLINSYSILLLISWTNSESHFS